MKIITVFENMVNPVSLPGMGKSIEVSDLSEAQVQEILGAFAQHELFVSFVEKPDAQVPVRQLWANPHMPQVTLFI